MQEIHTFIDSHESAMIELQKKLGSIPALCPEYGGNGEWEKARVLQQWLEQRFPNCIRSFAVPDSRVIPEQSRPALVLTLKGMQEQPCLWIMSHLDVVPPGDLSLWKTNPYDFCVKEGKLYGRGAEDNQQGLVSSVFAALAVKHTGARLSRTVKLLFVSDEEHGSDYGIRYLLEHTDWFHPQDEFLVPDSGVPDSTQIEVAEKNLLWLKFTVTGVQSHASRPDQGNNAFFAGSLLAVQLAQHLAQSFPQTNVLFYPNVSTFTPTKKEANVPNINTVPGTDIFYFDMRYLPEIGRQDVLREVENVCRRIEEQTRTAVNWETVQENASPSTHTDCGLVKGLQTALYETAGIRGVPAGIGGGTVAAYLRRKGFNAAVWATLEETAHMPNEYCRIKNMVLDSKVMAYLMLHPFCG